MGLFRRDNDVITVRITKTSDQSTMENLKLDEAIKRQKICPNCGKVSKDDMPREFGTIDDAGNHYLQGRCFSCKTEWEVKY